MKLSLSGRVTLVSNIVTLLVIGAAWGLGWPSELLFSYGLHKFLHITGVIMFAGNLVAGPLWILYAWFFEEGKHFAWATKTLSDADMYFTVPGIQLTLWNGGPWAG